MMTVAAHATSTPEGISSRDLIHHLARRIAPGMHFSLERVFETVRAHLDPRFEVRQHLTRYAPLRPAAHLGSYLHARRTMPTDGVIHVLGDVNYLALAPRRVPLALTIADIGWVSRRSARRWLFDELWYRRPVRAASAVTTISAFTRAELGRAFGIDVSRVDVIHCPLVDGFSRNDREFDHEQPVVLQIGSTPNKNLDRVIAALAGTRCRFHVVGKVTETQQAALRAGGVDFAAFEGVSDARLLELYRSADLVVFASLYEGFGMPIVEAQAIGRPVITSSRCSMPEVAGDAALFVDPEDASAIGRAIRELTSDRDRREELVGRGFENVRRFSAAAIAASYGDLYDRLRP